MVVAGIRKEATSGETRVARRIPRFQSVEEEAAFWDTHSPLDYPDEFQKVDEPKVDQAFDRPLRHLLGVRLDTATLTSLGEIARAKGIGPSTLARIWIMERLSSEEPAQPK